MIKHEPRFDREQTGQPTQARRRDLPDGSGRAMPSAADAQPGVLPGFEPNLIEIEPEPIIPPRPQIDVAATPSRQPRRRSRRTALAGVAAVLLLVVAGGTIWLLSDRRASDDQVAEIALIAADEGPEKVRPEDEGGYEVPNQGVRIYEELSGAAPAVESEVLLPSPELPLPLPLPPAEPPPVSAVNPGEAPATAPAIEVPEAPVVELPIVEPPVVAADAFRIQLAAIKSEADAGGAWAKLVKRHPEVLEGLRLDVVKLERESGVLYRLQGGPFADRAAAAEACRLLKEKQQDCLIVAP